MTSARRVRTAWLLVFLVLPGVSSAQTARPSVRFGEVVQLDVTMRLEGETRRVTPGLEADSGIGWDRRRIGVRGRLGKRVEFELERELAGNEPWRDGFVNLRIARSLQLRAGKFKMPFSLDQLTSASDLDFIYRSRVGDTLAPGRSVGAAVHGRVMRRALSYEVGVFRRDGDIARFGSNPGAGQTVAGRAAVRPFGMARAPSALRALMLGINATAGDVAEGRHSLRGRLASAETFFAPVFVKGRRVRFGVDADWHAGPLSLRAEFLEVREERREQGLALESLPPLVAQGWYASGTWRLLGRNGTAKDSRGPVRRLGRLELAARVERSNVGSSAFGQPELRNPRASNLMEMSDRAWTLGANWSPHRWFRLQANLIREQLNDGLRSPIVGRTVFWTRVARLQFVL